MIMRKKIVAFFVSLYAISMCFVLYHLRPLGYSLWGYETHNRLKIYMYPLDKQFNRDITVAYAKWNPNILNETGLGIPLNISEFAFDTNQFALEQYFYYRLTNSYYLTSNPSEADLFYIPFFPNLAKVAGHYQTYGKFWSALSKYNDTKINAASHKHFIVYGGCQKYAQAFMGAKLASKFSVIYLERNANKSMKTNGIIAPYPGQIHFHGSKWNAVDYEKKNLLVSSAWNSRYPIRWELAADCRKYKNICVHIELNSNSDAYNHSYLYDTTERSVFCLSPHGDSPTRKSFWDALLVGCINVIYDNTVKYPFDDIFDYNQLALYIPYSKRSNTFNILQNYSKDKIKNMQQYIEKNRIHFQYTNIQGKDTNNNMQLPLSQKDAFHLLLDEVYQRSLEKPQ